MEEDEDDDEDDDDEDDDDVEGLLACFVFFFQVEMYVFFFLGEFEDVCYLFVWDLSCIYF